MKGMCYAYLSPWILTKPKVITVDKQESYQLGLSAIQKIRTTHNDAVNANTLAAVASVKHFYEHADGVLVLKCRDELKEYGAKGANKAFLHLVSVVCSITKDGGIKDKAKHEAFKQTYLDILNDVELQGLTEWYNISTGAKDKTPKTDEEKAKAKAERQAKQAKAWLKEQAEQDTPEGVKYLVMLKYGEAFEKAYAENDSRALDQFEAHLNKLKGSIGGGVTDRIQAIAS